MKRQFAALLALALLASVFPLTVAIAQEPGPTGAVGSPEVEPNRKVEPVVLTGDRLPGWFSPAADGHPFTTEDEGLEGCGGECERIRGTNYRSAHNGTLVAPEPADQTGVEVDEIVAYRFDGGGWTEIPVQVDERFPYFLANGRSDFSFYSHTDRELSYEWDTEQWARTAGTCQVDYPDAIDRDAGHAQTNKVEDPVPSLDADDEVVFMADDAGQRATGPGPYGTEETRQEISIVDPRTGEPSYVYLFTSPQGPSFDDDHYVTFQRDANADDWIDRHSFAEGSPEQLGSSNTGYGPNLEGTVCSNPDDPTTARDSSDRFPRDGVTVSTDAYEWYASGRWMIRSMRVADPATGTYGPDLIDRWKGRAFQQSPDSSISLVGFEDEQVNWEANSATLGWLEGPVRAIREIWGADSGTNVTKTETFYRDAVTYRYRVRVHPIPPDGLYTSWDYNHDVATCYFNESHPECIEVDGQNDDAVQIDKMPEQYEQVPCDERIGTPDALPYGGGNNLCIEHAYFDATDPRHSKPLANLNWEQVSGAESAGSLVYMFEMKNAQSLENPLVVPYYRDDACLDDGTGDNPTPRKYPGEASFDERVYGEAYDDCIATDPATWTERQGCFACHGVHYFITGDTDNSFTPLNTTEIDGQQWQWAVPTETPKAVGAAYANTVKMPLVAAAAILPNEAGPEPSPTPTATATETATPSASPTPTPTPTEPAAEMPPCNVNGPEGSRKIEGYIPVAQDSPTEATTLHYQVLLPPCKDTDGNGTLDFKGPYPIVVDYSGYEPGISFFDGPHRHFMRDEGYAIAGVNIRGTGCSGGKFDYFEPRQSKDGAEAIEFLGEQSYTTGRVAMIGKSYPGITQLFVGAQQPEHLAAIVPGHVFGDLYRDVPYPGGIQNTTFAAGWSASRIIDMHRGPQYAIENQDEECGRNQAQHVLNPPFNPFVKAVGNHYDNELFMQRSPWYFAHKIEAPTLLVQSWQDEQVGSRATELVERFNEDLEWRMLATNGDHGEYYGSDVLPEIKRFLRYHLAQQVPTVDQDEFGSDFAAAIQDYNSESPVQINWETGAAGNRVPAWKKHYSQWPPPMVDQEDPWRLYLTDDGLLTGSRPTEEGEVTYNYTPGAGTQQRGGYLLKGWEDAPDETPEPLKDTWDEGLGGAYEENGGASWSETPAEGTYAMFQTNFLPKDALLAGPASLDLWVSSTAVDTDFQVTMTEVRPDGKETFVQQGWMRASHRRLIEDTRARSPVPIGDEEDPIVYDPTGVDDPRGPQDWSDPLRPFHSHLMKDSDPLVPGIPAPVRIEIFPFAHAFREGSAIRVYVEAPHTKPDLWGFALLPAPAQNTIYTGGELSSSVALPLLEGEVAEAALPACNMDQVHSPLRNQPCREAVRPLPVEGKPEPTATPTPTSSATATATPTPTQADRDGDGVADGSDNCPEVSNSDQQNTYGDARGDACEPSSDGGGGGGGGGGGQTPTPEPANSAAEDSGDLTTTIAVSDGRVSFGDPYTISGVVDGPRDCPAPTEVDLSRRVHGQTDLQQVATVEVGPDGTWTYTGRADVNASYVAAARPVGPCGGSSSSPIDVLVSVQINLRLPDSCRGAIRGRVLPAKGGSKIVLQKKRNGNWRRISSDVLNERSRFTLDTAGCGLHRIVFGGSATNQGATKQLRLRG